MRKVRLPRSVNRVCGAEAHIDRRDAGPIILHQWPEGAIATAETSSGPNKLFNFSTVSEYIIPRQDLCQQALSVSANGYRILGNPVCLEDPDKYARNEYIFNFCIVVREGQDASAYEKAVAKLARVLTDLEEQESFLLEDEENTEHAMRLDEEEEEPYIPQMRLLCENVLEDLNRYNECIIPLTDAHEINLRLFPSMPPGPVVKPFQVPLALMPLAEVVDSLWDMTMQRIAPHIDGVNHINRIAQLADVDLSLVQQATRQLVRFGAVVMLDMFHYGATYAPTADISELLFDRKVSDECASFASTGETVDGENLIRLYTSLMQGVTLKAWVLGHKNDLENIDVRRLITAGLMKGIIYRVHRYAVKDGASKGTGSLSSQDRQLDRYLDGTHCFDEICTALAIAAQDLFTRLRNRKDVYIFDR